MHGMQHAWDSSTFIITTINITKLILVLMMLLLIAMEVYVRFYERDQNDDHQSMELESNYGLFDDRSEMT